MYRQESEAGDNRRLETTSGSCQTSETLKLRARGPAALAVACLLELLVSAPRTALPAPPGVPEVVDPTTIDCTDLIWRGKYVLRVPCYTTETYRTSFIYPQTDIESWRTERYRVAFVIAVLQPVVTADLKKSANLTAGIQELAWAALRRIGLPDQVVQFAQMLGEGTGEFALVRRKVNELLEGFGAALGDGHLQTALKELGEALISLSRDVQLSADAWTELLIHADLVAAARRRIEVLEAWLVSRSDWDPALSKGFHAAKTEIEAFLARDLQFLRTGLERLVTSHGGALVRGLQLIEEVAAELASLTAEEFPAVWSVVLPWFLAYRTGVRLVVEAVRFQEMCAVATIDAELRWWAAAVYLEFLQCDPRLREGLRQKFLTAMEIRYALGHHYSSQYRDLLGLCAGQCDAIDWLRSLAAWFMGILDDIERYRDQVLARYVERDLEGLRNTRLYLQTRVNLWPQVSQVTVDPSSGDEKTRFAFSARYTDPDAPDAPPALAELVIDGTKVPLRFLGGRPGDGAYGVSLSLSAGNHIFYFQFFDKDGGFAASPWYQGPYVRKVGDRVVRICLDEGGFGCRSRCVRVRYGLEGGKWEEAFGDTLCGAGVAIVVPQGKKLRIEAFDVPGASEFLYWDTYCDGQFLRRIQLWTLLGIDPGDCDELLYVGRWEKVAGTYTISGMVAERSGAPIEGAVVRLNDRMAVTGADGKFAFSGVAGGQSYQLSASKAGYDFLPAVQVVDCLGGHVVLRDFVGLPGDRRPPEVQMEPSCPDYVEAHWDLRFAWKGTDDTTPDEALEYRFRVLGAENESWSPWSGATGCELDLSNGAYCIEVECRDKAGNVCFTRAKKEFIVNAAPRVEGTSPVRCGRWVSQVEVVNQYHRPGWDALVILTPQASGFGESGLVPVRLLDRWGRRTLGAADWLAPELGVPVSFEKARQGWKVRLPEIPEIGQRRTYLIQWGKLLELGWREEIPVPEPPRPESQDDPWLVGVGQNYVDDRGRLWRLVWRDQFRIPGRAVTRESRLWLEVWSPRGELVLRDLLGATVAEFQEEQGKLVGKTEYFGAMGDGFILDRGSMEVFWRVFGYEYRRDWSSGLLEGYARVVYDAASLVRKGGIAYSPLTRGTRYFFPKKLAGGDVFLISDIFPEGEILGSRMNPAGEVLEHNQAFFRVSNRENLSSLQVFPPVRTRDRLLLFMDVRWDVDGKERGEIYYLLLDAEARVLGEPRVLPPTGFDPSARYDFGIIPWLPVAAGDGRIWVSHGRNVEGRGISSYYSILGDEGAVLVGPVPSDWEFRYADRDGLLWANAPDGMYIVDPQERVVARGSPGAWIPAGYDVYGCGLVTPSGFRKFDRWSVVEFSVPGARETEPGGLTLQAVDWNRQGLGLRDVTVGVETDPLLAIRGEFTGSAYLDITQLFGSGPGKLWVKQAGALGGEIVATFEIKPEDPFVRGDANADSKINIADAIFLLEFLFLKGAPPPCERSADVEKNGILNLTDAIYLLNHLFLGGPEPPAPYPVCGVSPRPDAELSCEAFPPCE